MQQVWVWVAPKLPASNPCWSLVQVWILLPTPSKQFIQALTWSKWPWSGWVMSNLIKTLITCPFSSQFLHSWAHFDHMGCRCRLTHVPVWCSVLTPTDYPWWSLSAPSDSQRLLSSHPLWTCVQQALTAHGIFQGLGWSSHWHMTKKVTLHW